MTAQVESPGRTRRSVLKFRRALTVAVALAALLVALLGAPRAQAAGSGPPVNTVAPSLAGFAKEGDPLKAKEGTWTGEAKIEYSFRWERLEGGVWSRVGSEQSYPLTAKDVGKKIRFTVTARNKAGSAEATSPESETIAGVPPKNVSLPAITNLTETQAGPVEPREGQLLQASSGAWAGTPVTQYTYAWEACSKRCAVIEEKQAGESISFRVPSGSTLSGDTLRVTVTDENGVSLPKSATSAATAAIKAGPPVEEEAPSISGVAREGQTLNASRGRWAGTPTIEYSYQWSSCVALGGGCLPIAGATEATHSIEPGEVGAKLEITVTARNGQGPTSASVEAPVVLGTAPHNTVRPAISGETREGETLEASAGSWTGTPTISYAYAWERCSGGTCAAVGSGSTYTLQAGDIGDTIEVGVTASNGVEPAGHASSEATAPVLGNPPNNTVRPAISGEAREGETLEASAGSWTGTPTISYSYAWERCSGGTCTAVGSGSTYSLQAGDIGDTLEVGVTASNGVEPAGHAVSEPTAVVLGNAPRNTGQPAISGEAREGETLEASAGSWTGAATIAYTFTWERCGAGGCAAIPGAGSGNTYVVQAGDIGDTIKVAVRASNGVEPAGHAVSGSTAVVLGNAPKNTTPPTIAGEARDGQTLEASAGSWTGTPTVAYTYTWERCGAGGCASIPGAGSGATYTVQAGDIGNTIEVTVTASNPIEPAGHVASAPTPVVLGTKPVNTEPPTITGQALEGQTLTAVAGKWTGTQLITYSSEWQRCSAPGACTGTGATGATYAITPADLGSAMRVVVTASNSAGQTTAPSAETANVQRDGQAAGWGENYHGELGLRYRDGWEMRPVPSGGVQGIAELAAGGSSVFARLDSGEVVGWGGNDAGENGDDEQLSVWEQGLTHVTVDELANENPNDARPLAHVTQLASANEHALALLENHKVKTWGSNGYGQLGVGVQGFEIETEVNAHVARSVRWPFGSKTPEELEEIKAVTAGGGSDYALTKQGTVWAWGDDREGQLGVQYKPRTVINKEGQPEEQTGPEHCKTEVTHGAGFEACSEFPRKVVWADGKELTGVKAVYASSYSAYALLEDGELVSWGSNSTGQLGTSRETIHSKDTPPEYVERYRAGEAPSSERLTGVVEVAAGLNSVLVKLDQTHGGEVLGFGNAEFGALALPTPSGEEFKHGAREENCHNRETLEEERTRIAKEEATIKRIEGEIAEAKSKGETKLVTELEAKLAKDKKKLEAAPEPKFCVRKATYLKAITQLNAEQLSEGNHYGVALTEGKVLAWGSNERGQQGNGIEPAGETTESGNVVKDPGYPVPAEVQGLGRVVEATATASSHVSVLLAAGVQPPPAVLDATAEQGPAMTLAWEAKFGAEPSEPLRILYSLSELKGEPPVAEEGEGGEEGQEGPPENVMAPQIEFEEEPLEEAPVVGEQLRGTSGTWAGTHPKFEYQWWRCKAGGGGCVKIYRCSVKSEKEGQVIREHFEITAEENLARCTETESPSRFTGHKVQPNDSGSTLRYEVIATNAEGQVSAHADTLPVKSEAGAGEEEEVEKGTSLSCKGAPKVPKPACVSPLHLSQTFELERIEGTKKTRINPEPLLAELYEVHVTFAEPEREKTKIRTMVVLPEGPAQVLTSPTSVSVKAGAAARFQALASGGPRPTVQWEVSTNGGTSWSVVPGADASSFVIPGTTVPESGEEFRASFTNANSPGPARSEPATLTVEG